jgi:hypothetical protein
MRCVAPILVVFILCASVTAANINVTYNINTDVNRTPISKYIYGSNGYGDANYTIVRSGGNRLTAYNWENNYSNAGADYGPYNNDNYMVWSQSGIPSGQYLVPGKAITYFRDRCIADQQDSIVTLQMAGYVSADGSGLVTLPGQVAPSSRFKKVVFAKGSAFTLNPVTTDANVYMDEFVNFLVNSYGRAGTTNGIKFYDLDNEPDLWSDGAWGATHPEVHQADPCCVELKDKTVALAIAVKNVDPNAQLLGPVSYGFQGFRTFQDAVDWPAQTVNNYDPNWFLSYYLDKMEANSVAAGKRLLDVLDVHWYPEARDGNMTAIDGNRITDVPSVYSAANCNARMQAPRTLWDTSYVYPDGEVSWINRWVSNLLPIIPNLKKTITNYYPDTNLAFTEYDYGGQTHWSGGIATADVLGIFGKYGVYIANYWGGGSYVNAAVKIYTNYDNAKSTFGDTEVYSIMSNKVDSSIYASVFSDYACELHMIVINKNIDNAISGTFNITSPQKFKSGRVWHFDSASVTITETTAINNITGNSFAYTVPATTVLHIVLQTTPTAWDLTGDCAVNIWDLKAFANSWLAPPGNYNFVNFADFAQDWGI